MKRLSFSSNLARQNLLVPTGSLPKPCAWVLSSLDSWELLAGWFFRPNMLSTKLLQTWKEQSLHDQGCIFSGAHFEMMWKSAPHLNIVSKIRHSCLPHVNINLDPSPTCPHSCHMFLLQPQSSHHWPNLSRQRMPKSGEVYMCAWCATDPSPHHIWDSCLSTANMKYIGAGI